MNRYNYNAINRYFTLAVTAFLPILGSLVSVLWHGGALYSVGMILARRQPLTRDRHIAVLATLAYIYVACGVVSAVANSITTAELPKLLPLATFLLFPFSYSIWCLSDKRTIAHACFIGSMIACFGAVVLALIQFHILGIRAEGGAGNSLVFSQVVAMAGTVCLAAALSIGRKMVLFLLSAFLASLVAIVYAESRTVWVSTLCTTILILWIYRRNLPHVLSRRMTLGGIFILALIAVASFHSVSDRFQVMFDDLNHAFAHGDYRTPIGQRLALWQIGLHLVQEKPVLGYGMQSTRELIHHGLQAGYGAPFKYSHFHNGILTLLIEAGIGGALAIVAIFLAASIYAWRTLRSSDDEIERFGATVLASFVCLYFLSGMTNLLVGHDIIDTTLMIFLTIGSYLALGTSMLPRKPGNSAPSSD